MLHLSLEVSFCLDQNHCFFYLLNHYCPIKSRDKTLSIDTQAQNLYETVKIESRLP